MEGVPRMPMLEIELKQNSFDYSSLDWAGMPTEDVHEATQQQITDGLKKHIKEEYGDDPEKFNDAIEKFIEVQTAAYKALLSIDFEGCNTLKKYYGQLHYMQSRFPFSGDDGIKATFTWQDAFTGILTVHESFTFEQTAVLFNIGAIHSCLGAMDSRTTEEGIRISCVHFQCAAGLFTYIADHFDTTLSPDISQFMLKLFINVMLAQGQECLLEKSMQDNRKHSIVSKISQQVVEYYKQCLQSLDNRDCKDTLGSQAHAHWKRVISFKVAYYSAITKYYMGNNSLDQDKYGQAVAFFGASVGHLNETTKLAKSLQKETRLKVEEALKFTSDVLNGKYNSSVKDNNFVYHDKIPDVSALPEVKGASLVKALPFEPANESLTGPDIFAKLVPMEAHLAASTYSEEKAKLLRSVVEKINEKDEILSQYKQSVELDPKKLINYTETSRLDQTLIEKCAQLSIDQSPITQLQQALEDLTQVYSDLDSTLDDILALAENEETEDLKFQDVAGQEAFSTAEDVEGIKKELTVYKEIHHKASQMNDDLHTACRIHISNMKLIAGGMDSLKEELNLIDIADLLTEEDKNVVGMIHKLCDKVVEMEVQRKNLLQQLRQQMESDDVTSTLVTKHGVDQEDLFKEELRKHDSQIDTINRNLSAQDNILDAVTEANARYTKIRKTVDTERERVDQKVGNLILSCEVYEDVLRKCKEGEKFFAEVLEKSKQLYGRAKEFCDENEEKRSKIYKKIEEKEKAKRPPPRPSAPKPKLNTKKSTPNPPTTMRPPISSGVDLPPMATGITLSPDILAKMMAEDEDELLNDPEFLQFLQSQGDLQSMDFTSLPASANASYTNMPGMSPSRPHAMPPSTSIQQQQNYPAISSPQVYPSHNAGILPSHPSPHPTPPPSQTNYPQLPQQVARHGGRVSQSYSHQNVSDPRLSPAPSPHMRYSPRPPLAQPPQSQHGTYVPPASSYSAQNIPSSHLMQQQTVVAPSPVPSQFSRSDTPLSQPMSPVPQNVIPMTPQGPVQHVIGMSHAGSVMTQNAAMMPSSIAPTPQRMSPGPQSMDMVPQSMAPMPQTVAPQVVHNNYYSTQQQPQAQPVQQPPPVQVSQVAIVYSAPPPCHQSVRTTNTQPVTFTSGNMVVPPNIALLQPPQSASGNQQVGQPYYASYGNTPASSVASTPLPGTPQVMALQQIGSTPPQNNPQVPMVVPSNQQVQPQLAPGQIYPNQAPTPPMSTSGQYISQPLQQFNSLHPATSAMPQQYVLPQSQSPAPQAHYATSQPGANVQQNFMSPTSAMQPPPPVSRYSQNMLQQQYPMAVSQSTQVRPQTINFSNQAVPPAMSASYPNTSQSVGNQVISNGSFQQPGLNSFQLQRNVMQPQPGMQSGYNTNQPTTSTMDQQLHGTQSYQQVPVSHQSVQQLNQFGESGQSWNQGIVSSRPNELSSGQNVAPAGQGIAYSGQSYQSHQVIGGMQPVSQQSNMQQQMHQSSSQQQFPSPRLPSSVSQVGGPQPHISNSMPQLQGHTPQVLNAMPQQHFQRMPSQNSLSHGQAPGTMQTMLPQSQNQMPVRDARPPTLSGMMPHNTTPQPGTMPSRMPDVQPRSQNPMPQARVSIPQQNYSQHANMQTQPRMPAPQGRVQSDSTIMPPPQENYTFKSHPHAGQYLSTPSNENSPKHISTQHSRQGSTEASGPSQAILTPTPVNQRKPTPIPPMPRQPSSDLAGLILTPTRSHSSSADELLFTSPDQGPVSNKNNNQVVLVPTKVDEESDKMVVRPVEGLPYMDDADLMKFKGQVVEFRSKVGTLLHKPESNGLCELDREWKELSEEQEKFSRQLSTAIARCSSYKNRYQDIVPFDQSRVILKEAKDDYINASVIDGVSHYCPRFIATQSPLANTISDFWLMIYEQQVTLIVMLVNSKDLPKKCPMYWPADRSVPQQHGPLTVSFTTSKTHGDLYIERTFTMKHKNQSLAMSVTQLQYMAWPEHRLPSSASDLLSFLTVVQSYHGLQRNLQLPVLVHCESGVGRTGVFCSFLAGINEINAGMGIVNVIDILTKMRQKRKYMVQEKAQLKFVYDVILYHAIDVLKRRKIFLEEEVKPVSVPQQVHQHHPVNSTQTSGQFDIFSNQSALSSIQATVEKMTIKPESEKAQKQDFTPSEISSKSCSDIPDSRTSYEQQMPQVRPNTSEHFSSNQLPQMTNELDSYQNQNVMGSLSDLVQGTMPAPITHFEPPLENRESTAPMSSIVPKPDVVESCNSQTDFEPLKPAADPSMPVSTSPTTLIESLTPESFTLTTNEEEANRKRKVTKEDFFKPRSGLISETDPADPFSGLDPLWGLKK